MTMSFYQDDIPGLVRQVVSRTLGQTNQRIILDEESVRKLPAGSTQSVPSDVLVTPLARQVALERGIKLVESNRITGDQSIKIDTNPSWEKTGHNIKSGMQVIAFGADHGGFELKEKLKDVVTDAGYQVYDCGTHSKDSVDYPDYAFAVARLVSEGQVWRGIIVDGAGIGSCMAANKVPGVRAALCYDQATAHNSREHNNANILTLGAGLIGPNLAGQIVRTWLVTKFGGGRHARRVDKIDAIGNRFMKKDKVR
jgi:ribose 5-phosphate isomerase B